MCKIDWKVLHIFLLEIRILSVLQEVANMKKRLVAYFSASGVTKKTAQIVERKQLNRMSKQEISDWVKTL